MRIVVLTAGGHSDRRVMDGDETEGRVLMKCEVFEYGHDQRVDSLAHREG
jgi:hypothetical protein